MWPYAAGVLAWLVENRRDEVRLFSISGSVIGASILAGLHAGGRRPSPATTRATFSRAMEAMSNVTAARGCNLYAQYDAVLSVLPLVRRGDDASTGIVMLDTATIVLADWSAPLTRGVLGRSILLSVDFAHPLHRLVASAACKFPVLTCTDEPWSRFSVSIGVGGLALGDAGLATRSERAALHRAGVRMPLKDQAYVGYGRCAVAKRMCLGVHRPSIADFDAGYATASSH